MIQIYWTDTKNFLNGYEDFAEGNERGISDCINKHLREDKNQKIVIKKFPGRDLPQKK